MNDINKSNNNVIIQKTVRELSIKGYSNKTSKCYINCIKRFDKYIHKDLDEL